MVADTEEQLGQWVPQAVSGDAAALNKVIRLIYPPVLRYTRARISGGVTPTPEDVAQDICFAVSTSIHSYVDRGRPFMAFVYGIAFNKVADAHRSLARDRLNPTEEVPETAVEHDTPEELAMISSGSNRVRLLLDSLSEKSRNILILRVFEGLSAEETAAIVGSTPGAVRVAQHRALATLRRQLDQEEEQ
ncbi:sigma-70 family RNA polymerase sigma factor [Corynebacterium poyangense]|uniref:Sigma-70 family RNA polymerase sigma factor n=1 Tax=Corynebacterium poyangense TaxID=2684405 RepID=A0A7H0SMA5_9CORY|nr:sigma-70 family RNA polymerase sigma factor [Corynebacterium poyangense]MBZ8176780.1 sigma-70 family RNA polymerase sigma factor [Corynebacterium poyangense]QNQ89680.1 sigma-70 family RNA polymerase sigma factor [Corynebacterium poyangense]